VALPEIRALATRLIQGKVSDLQKLRAIHQWVHRNIRHGGKRLGTRDGTMTVLKRKFGRCWDMADVLVSLARAVGLPARQVAGWVARMGGHIWTEIYVAGRGWVSVDATVPWIGVHGSYVPLMTTTDGHMLPLYVQMPVLKRIR
jgi:transglutaminase-like putative cysteine protease